MNSKVKVLSLLVLLAQAYVTPAFASIELVFPWHFYGDCDPGWVCGHGLDNLRWGSTVFADVYWSPSELMGFGLLYDIYDLREYYKGDDGYTYQEMTLQFPPEEAYWYIYVRNYGDSTIDYDIWVWDILYG